VAKGVNNTRVMPAWKGRLNDNDIKLLAVYVHQLGGAK
jgi:cytochrome c oxidase cbb3-type subunit 3